MNGVAKLFTHYDGYARAEKISGGSKNWGLTFCVGTWSEGGTKMGKDVFQMIRDFGKRGKIFEVHFRNVSSPLAPLRGDFPGRRLHGHVSGDEGAPASGLRRTRRTRPCTRIDRRYGHAPRRYGLHRFLYAGDCCAVRTKRSARPLLLSATSESELRLS